jgi:hypothetical protein
LAIVDLPICRAPIMAEIGKIKVEFSYITYEFSTFVGRIYLSEMKQCLKFNYLEKEN